MPRSLPELRFHATLITPLFLYGFYPPPRNSREPSNSPAVLEMREESLIGQLRYWFRAVHATAGAAREKEAILFGHAEKRGILNLLTYLVHPNQNPQLTTRSPYPGLVGRTEMLPGKTGSGGPISLPSMLPGTEFRLAIAFRKEFPRYQPFVQDLVLLVSLLGGLGRRSRRGMGSFRLTAVTQALAPGPGTTSPQPDFDSVEDFLTQLLHLLNRLYPDGFVRRDQHVERRRDAPSPEPDFPRIQRIWIGQQPKQPADVYQATHKAKLTDPRNYGHAMGDAGRSRLASPMYTSFVAIQGRLYPVLTELSRVSGPAEEIRKNYRHQLGFVDHTNH